jgi:hypothetical protein
MVFFNMFDWFNTKLNEHIPAMMHTNYEKFCPMVVLILDFRSTKNNITDVMVFQWYFMYGEEVALSYWSTQKTFYLNKRQRISKGQSQKDNPEKLALNTRRRKTKQKHNTSWYVLHTTIHKQTQKGNSHMKKCLNYFASNLLVIYITIKDTTGTSISIFPLWTFHLYVATFQQHLHVEYIYIYLLISLIDGCY